MYDYDLLKDILMNNGFKGVKRSLYQNSNYNFPDVKILDNRAEDTLFIEAYK